MEPSRQIVESKRLIVVIDSAADLNFHWNFSLKNLIADIARSLHPEGSTSQDLTSPRPLLGLIVYGSQGPCTEPQVKPWGWTYDLKIFLEWLSAVSFTSGEFSETALAKALSSTLQFIGVTNNVNAVGVFGRTHCILVTCHKSSPNDEISDKSDISLRKMDRFLIDATSVARRFMQSFVSLSVLSPLQSSRLNEIFRAGNGLPRMNDRCTDDQEEFNYLILLSDNFKESHDALSYRDFIVAPATEKDKGKVSVFCNYPIPKSKEKSSGIRASGVGQSSGVSRVSSVPVPTINEALPINDGEPSLVDILTQIEVRLLEDKDYGDGA